MAPGFVFLSALYFPLPSSEAAGAKVLRAELREFLAEALADIPVSEACPLLDGLQRRF